MNKKVNKNENKIPSPKIGVYSIWCATYNKPYIGEASRPLKKRIYEHKKALLIKGSSYAPALGRNQKKQKNLVISSKESKHYKTYAQ